MLSSYAMRLILDAVFANSGASAALQNVAEHMYPRQSVSRGVEETSVPVVICVPARLRFVIKDRLLSGKPRDAEVDYECIAVASLPHGINTMYSATDLDCFIPCIRSEPLRGNFSMTRKVLILCRPCGLIMLVVIEPHPEILHPFVNVLWLGGIGDMKQALAKEVLDLLRREMLVFARHVEDNGLKSDEAWDPVA